LPGEEFREFEPRNRGDAKILSSSALAMASSLLMRMVL